MNSTLNLKLEYCQLGNPTDTEGAFLTQCVVLKTWEHYGSQQCYIMTAYRGVIHIGRAYMDYENKIPGAAKYSIYSTNILPKRHIRAFWNDEAWELFSNFYQEHSDLCEQLKSYEPRRVFSPRKAADYHFSL